MARIKKKPQALADFISSAAGGVEHEALRAISERLASLFEDPAFEAALLAAAGKKKASQSFLDAIANDIKERAFAGIARVHEDGLY